MTQDSLFDGWGSDEDFNFASGLKDDYDGEIISAIFAYDAQYNNGETLCLILEVKAEDGDTVRTLYPCGTGWVNADNGQRAVREDGKQVGFNKSTAVVQLITSIAKCEGSREALVPNGFRPTYCPPLVGTKWHWNSIESNYNIKDKATNEMKKITSSRPYPTAFLGSENGAAKKKATTTKKAKNTWDGLSGEDINAFREIAAECDDHKDFVAKVSEEFEDWPEEAIMDEKFFDFLKA